MNKVTISENNCNGVTIGGIQGIWYFQRSKLGRWWTYAQTHTLQYAVITGSNTLRPSKWIKLLFSDDTAQFTQIENKVPSRSYQMQFTVNVNSMNILNRDKLEQLSVTSDLCVIFLDFNGRYWLMGETNGCYVEIGEKTDVIFGKNDMSIDFTCTERYPIRQVSASYVAQVIDTAQYIFSLLDWPTFNGLSWAQFDEYQW